MTKPIQRHLPMKDIFYTFIFLAIIVLVNCASTCEDFSFACQQAKLKSNECNEYTGQKQTDCYKELRVFQTNCCKQCGNSSKYNNLDTQPTKANDVVRKPYPPSKTETVNPDFVSGGYVKGNRTKRDIMITMINNISKFNYYYNERKMIITDLQGKIFIQFYIASSGNVYKANVLENTTNDALFTELIVNEVLRLDFGKNDITADTTEVGYPFVFSQ